MGAGIASVYRITKAAVCPVAVFAVPFSTLDPDHAIAMPSDGNGVPVKYYEIELENVLIGSMDQVVHEGSGLHDSFSLKFSKVKWKYCQQKIAGGAGGNTQGGWDLSTNRIA